MTLFHTIRTKLQKKVIKMRYDVDESDRNEEWLPNLAWRFPGFDLKRRLLRIIPVVSSQQTLLS